MLGTASAVFWLHGTMFERGQISTPPHGPRHRTSHVFIKRLMYRRWSRQASGHAPGSNNWNANQNPSRVASLFVVPLRYIDCPYLYIKCPKMRKRNMTLKTRVATHSSKAVCLKLLLFLYRTRGVRRRAKSHNNNNNNNMHLPTLQLTTTPINHPSDFSVPTTDFQKAADARFRARQLIPPSLAVFSQWCCLPFPAHLLSYTNGMMMVNCFSFVF